MVRTHQKMEARSRLWYRDAASRSGAMILTRRSPRGPAAPSDRQPRSARGPTTSTPQPVPKLPSWLAALQSAEALFVADARQRIVAWSPSAERLFGRSASEVLGRRCYEVVAGTEPDGHPVCRRDCRVVRNARRRRVTETYEIVAQASGDERVALSSSIVLAPDESGAPPYLVHLLRPIGGSGPARALSKQAGRRLGTAIPATGVPPVPQPLSRREFEVLRLLAAGLGTREIADRLTISPLTARNHIANIERKLGARSRLEAVVLAAHHELL